MQPLRHDWTVAEVEAVLARPFHDLLAQAHDTHGASTSSPMAHTAAPPRKVGRAPAATISTRPQVPSAANWLNKVAEGVRL